MTPTASHAPGPDIEADGDRFEFGQNWQRFAADLQPESIEAARESLASMLGRESLEGLKFLDIGSGSGIFSLAAARMGADRVHSTDYDPLCVRTTESLRERFAPQATWTAERADILDSASLGPLGEWDIVTSWGVLHHTGDLWGALENTCSLVAPNGLLFIAIGNDQGWPSMVWTRVKWLYNRLPEPLKPAYVSVAMLPTELRSLLSHVARGELRGYLRQWSETAASRRGMSRWRDWFDWVGGYPFEVATVDEVFRFCAERGFELRRLRTEGRAHGCNEFVFERSPDR